jgi:Flp pilus assembly protein TadB
MTQLLVNAFVGSLMIAVCLRVYMTRCARRSLTALAGAAAGDLDLEVQSARPERSMGRLVERSESDTRLMAPDDSSELLLFRAGIVSPSARHWFRVWARVFSLVCLAAVGGLAVWMQTQLAWLFFVCGAVVGLTLPRAYLRRRAKSRDEEILFHLPLVLEQIVLGVGSSLDIAPCIKWVVEMAEERDTHNAVTELLAMTLGYMRSGVAIHEALDEVARMSGHVELKHVFMALSQVVRHGGEVSKQLHELANSVAGQREVAIEERIKGLEIRATGPVALIFAVFMSLFLTCLGIQIMTGFTSSSSQERPESL